MDAKFGRRNDMEEHKRKKYRKYISVAYLSLALITFCIFIAERIYRINLGLFKCAIIYMIPILYILYINKRFAIH